ncbi:DUF2020 domain-containing protein [Corynebacterium sp. UBA2622]|uniref:DUF2020 domain-containing protein n=1 Tax=Corynebacterium sp. UBA2622 TaxID=1946393 RepID=UPI0025C2E9C0|nr:DUF2020 domain-containing protein [Corynebacterium sp. UBA2622]
MRLTLPTALAAAALVLAGCAGGSDAPSPTPEPPLADAPAPAPDQGLPVDAMPATDRAGFTECPYLDTQWVADTNGQRVTGAGTDTRFDTPACQFWSYPEEPQLTVVVRHMRSPEEARAVVDWATPVAVTDPASQPSGWNGGRAGGGQVPGYAGAIYSVAKGPVAVSVWSNQQESVKTQAVAEETIARLGL